MHLMRAHLALRLFTVVTVVAVAHFVLIPVQAQVRGVYPVGMSATNSGVTPEAGISYSNLFVFFSRDEEKGPDGEIVATGQNSIMMDMNSFVWVSKKEMISGRSSIFGIRNASNCKQLAHFGYPWALSGGGGFADSYYQPFIFGWRKQRVAIRAIYGFLAPTGRFSAGASTNVGSGYWTSVVASGQTIYLNSAKPLRCLLFRCTNFMAPKRAQWSTPARPLTWIIR